MRIAVLVVAALLIVNSVEAQRGRSPGVSRRVQGVDLTVRVMFASTESAASRFRVQLMSSVGIPVGDTFTDSTGQARFPSVMPGNYRVRVSGNEIEDTESDSFTVDAMQLSAMQMVFVKKIEAAKAGSEPAGGVISAAALNIPEKARNEFKKALEETEKKKFEEAIKHLNKATEIYPHYAQAFDLLGVITAQSSPSDAKKYFEQAIAADEQYPQAYVHLAKAEITQKDFNRAITLLSKGSQLDPRSAECLFLLAYSDLQLRRLDDAISTAERAHTLEHNDFVLIHFIAGEAYARKGQRAQAIEHYSQYLKEAPMGPQAEQAKEVIRILQAQADPGSHH
jgi:tetratricopeptide (TPR) repeat protein